MIICVCQQNVESGLEVQTDDLTSAIDYIKTYMTGYVSGNELKADFYTYVNFSFLMFLENVILTFTFAICYRPSVCRLSVCLSVVCCL